MSTVDPTVHSFAMTRTNLRSRRTPSVRRLAPRAVLATLAGLVAFSSVLLAGPAGAQYGSGPSIFVDPVLVEIDGDFDAVGFNCPGATMVVITIDGFPDMLGEAPANDDNSYGVPQLDMPDGVVAGEEYTVRATCDGRTATTTITATCNDGSLPTSGSCPDGLVVGGQPDPVVSTTTTPGAVPTTTPSDSGTTSRNTPDGDNSSPTLAVTGASFAEQAAQVGITLVAFGAILVLLTSRRRNNDPA